MLAFWKSPRFSLTLPLTQLWEKSEKSSRPIFTKCYLNWVSEWVIVVNCQMSNISAISWRKQVWWCDNDNRFVLDQHAELVLYCASSLKQQHTGIHIAPLKHIILIPINPVFGLARQCWVLFDLILRGLEPTMYRTRSKHTNHYTIDANLYVVCLD